MSNLAKKRTTNDLYGRIRAILESARSNVARSVNTTQVVANWLIGQEIVEEEQRGKARAGYGEQIIGDLARRLTTDFGSGYSKDNLFWFRRFYLGYPSFVVAGPKVDAVRQLSSGASSAHAHARQETPAPTVIPLKEHAWRPGEVHPNLSWTHYRTLLRVDNKDARSFYEIEAVGGNWSARELERQINSLLYERLALSKNKKGLLKLARRGHEVQTPAELFKDPVVLEFLGLPESPRLVESELEQALIGNLQTFLLELGKGFAFVARQQRLTLDGDHFYIDLVFYHTILKCYIVIDLKTGKLTHQDLGQLQLYVNYYDRERRSEGDGPTLGLILCTDKNDAVVRYTLSTAESRTIFASRYKLHVPSVAELKAEMRRELKMLQERR